ncbi:hypothetical protein AZI85_14390 [Bdellovibrio bacteriovorus]|uniref:EF-hand domain-containing protein n=1 Tax=Bdellovibrio bacteriovorus TaxID=959 RepID=A0A150WV29_BDEBC|nr:hypothetical protein [Bdellovibrio bacteriovorus]KYG70324.1 hypothetical protein AZI85_14390 [Bdellovibrio bacteriovorus]
MSFTTAKKRGVLQSSMHTIKYHLVCTLLAGTFTTLIGCSSSTLKNNAPLPIDVIPDEITDDEYRDQVCDHFQALDKNKDRRLDQDEAKHLPSWIGHVKPSRPDGKVTIIDVVETANKKFKAHAKTKPDSLTEEEFKNLQEGK